MSKPTFDSKYRSVDVVGNVDGVEVTFPVEVIDDAEIQGQKELRINAVKRSYGIYKEKTEISYSKRAEKLFYLQDETEIIKALMSDVGPSMTSRFKYRSYADVLESKIPLVSNEEYKKAMRIAIKSLREYGVIHPKLKEVLSRLVA